VHHLGEWYAQAHPTEDFAETFAVWLKPNSDWRRSYETWPARHKLQFVDELMREVSATRPAVRNRYRIEPLESNRRTLAEHYAAKLARHGAWRRGAVDGLLSQIFRVGPGRRGAPRAAAFLRANRSRLVAAAARDTGETRYSAWQMLRIAVSRADQMNLYLSGSQREALRHARWLLDRLLRTYDQNASPQLHL